MLSSPAMLIFAYVIALCGAGIVWFIAKGGK